MGGFDTSNVGMVEIASEGMNDGIRDGSDESINEGTTFGAHVEIIVGKCVGLVEEGSIKGIVGSVVE